MHGQPPVFGFQNTNESKETPDEQLGLPASGGLRSLPFVAFEEESKGWFRGRGPNDERGGQRSAGMAENKGPHFGAWLIRAGCGGVVTQSGRCESPRNPVNKCMRLTEHSPDNMTRPRSGKASFHFVPATPMEEEPKRIPPPEVSHARFYVMLSCAALVVSLGAWRYLDMLEERLGRRIPPVLKAMKAQAE